jgi:hypothetical protein
MMTCMVVQIPEALVQSSSSPPSMIFATKNDQSIIDKVIAPENTVSEESRRTRCFNRTSVVIVMLNQPC